MNESSPVSRRAVIVAGGATVAAAALSGCGSPARTETSERVILGPVADIPVGGGVIYPAVDVVVTQPEPGEFLGFTAVCPHQSCLVGEVTTEGILCRCHGSAFAPEDGRVLSGPAVSGLARVDIRVENGILILG